MSPRKCPNRNTPITPTPPPLPPPQLDAVMFQAAVTTAITATMMQINFGGTSRAGTSTHYNHGDSCKPRTFNGTGRVIALSQWTEKTELIVEICSCPENSNVKFVVCSFSNRALTWWNVHVKSLNIVEANKMD